MHFLILQVLSAVAFSQLLRHGQMRLRPMVFIIACNYVAAFACSLVRYVGGDHIPPDTALLVMGIANGIFYCLHLPVMMASFHRAGVGITSAISVSGCVGPVIMAWALWPEEEAMTATRWAAVALIPIAMFMLRPAHGETLRFSWRSDVTLFATFFIAATVGSIHKLASHHGGDAGHAGYQVVLFASAIATAWTWVIAKRWYGNRGDVILGTTIGAVNAGGTVVLLLALSVMPASVYFPVASSAIIVGNLIASRLLWGERIARRQGVGIAMAIVIVWLAAGA